MPARGKVGAEVDLENVERKGEMKFVSLHHHSTYSFLDGYGHPEEHVRRAAELGMGSLALTEHGNVSSHAKLEQAANKVGIKPIFGCELYTGEGQVQRKNHLTVLAETREGYRNLLRLLTWAWKEGFYYEPTVTGAAFAEHQEGLVVLSGCTGGLLATSLVGGKNIREEDASFERGLRVARRFRELLGDRYYLEVQAFPELESTRAINPMVEAIGERLDIPLIATADVHYCVPEDSTMQTILHAVRPGSKRSYEDQERSWGYHIKLCHPTSDKQVVERLVGTGLAKRSARAAVASTAAVAERCDVELPKASPLAFNVPFLETPDGYWKRLLREGWDHRRIDDKERAEEYADRLLHEVELIESKNFVEYFLIVSDMTRWAKDNGIFVGPARGSAAASLVCYLLRITEVDPMLFPDLLFERFIDVTRKDLPDIDLDFDDKRRNEVFTYLEKTYGTDYVGHLGTFTTYKAKLALDDVSRVYRIPREQVDQVKDLLIVRLHEGDARNNFTIADTLQMFDKAKAVAEEYPDIMQATKLEGMIKGMSRHAAGAIVAATPITETCAIYNDTLALDKYDAEYLNLLKIDALGLNTMGMISDAADMLGMTYDDFIAIPLDDEETLRGFQEGDVVGVFQFDGRATRLVNNQLIPDNFYEVCTVSALSRPGPLHSGSAMQYIDIKHGAAKYEPIHPLYDAIVAHTQHQVVYQEQILRIVTEVSDFDWTDKAHIRKVISKKIGRQEMDRQWEKFWKGAKKNGVNKEASRKIWDYCITAGAYAFNAAHTVSYGMISWWTMWIKRHHPDVFFVAALRRLSDEKTLHLLRDAARHGIEVLPPDPRVSGVTWQRTKDGILAGFSQIPGIGPKNAEQIIEWRESQLIPEIITWEDLINVSGIGPKKMEDMMAFTTQDDPFGVHVLDKTLKRVVKLIKNGSITTADGSYLPMPTHTVETLPVTKGSDQQIVWIGTITYRNHRDLFEYHFSKTGNELDPGDVKDPHLREWVSLHGNDGDESVTLNINRWRYPRFREAVWNLRIGRDLVLIRGIKKGRDTQKLLHVTDMWVIEV